MWVQRQDLWLSEVCIVRSWAMSSNKNSCIFADQRHTFNYSANMHSPTGAISRLSSCVFFFYSAPVACDEFDREIQVTMRPILSVAWGRVLTDSCMLAPSQREAKAESQLTVPATTNRIGQKWESCRGLACAQEFQGPSKKKGWRISGSFGKWRVWTKPTFCSVWDKSRCLGWRSPEFRINT